jgi:hypothetical protein
MSLDEVRKKLRIFEQIYVGIRPIPVSDIVGTTDRSSDFGPDFLPLRPDVRDRWRRIEQAFPEGAFPPIVVYQLGDAYFVVDGHHRVAVAKQRGVEQIDAEVTQLHSPLPFGPDTDVARVIHAGQEQMFLEESGLARSRPEARIEFSRPTGYVELLELVRAHGYHVMIERGEFVPIEEIAADWYDCIYLPALEAFARERLREAFPDRTDGDLFLWIWQRRRALFPERGGLTMEEAARLARAEQRRRRLRSGARRTAKKLTPTAPEPVPENQEGD